MSDLEVNDTPAAESDVATTKAAKAAEAKAAKAAAKAAQQNTKTDTIDDAQRRVRIIIPRVKGGGDTVDVVAGYRLFRIKRGEEVSVPPEVVENLKDAVSTEYEQVEDERTGKAKLVPIKVQNYPFQILD